MGELKFRTNGGLVRTTGGGVSFGCKARHEGDFYIGGNVQGITAFFPNRVAAINNSDGLLDTGFNSGGAGANNSVLAMAVQSDGKILIGGAFTTYNGTSAVRFCRLNSDGSLDTGFNSGGAGANGTVYSVAVQSDGKILIGGTFTTYNGTTVGRVCRLNSDGSLDAGFNSGGAGSNSYVFSMAMQTDGKILIGGQFITYNGTSVGRVCRLNSDGSLDTGFNSGGAGANNIIESVALQTDGKIIIVGQFTTYNGTSVVRVCRLNSDGSLDTGFNSGGAGANSYVYAVAIQSDGKILIGGTFTTYNGTSVGTICRLNSDGSLDTGFNSGGAGPGVALSPSVESIAVQTDGKILIAGTFTTYNGTVSVQPFVGRFCRLNSDGSLDTNFNRGGGADTAVYSIVVRGDGKIFIGGEFTKYGPGTNTMYGIIKGSSISCLGDSTFNTAGAGTVPVAYAGTAVSSIAAHTNGKVLIGGTFTTYNGTSVGYFCRLNSDDGSLDTGFNSGGAGANNYVLAMAVQTDGKILIGGTFTTYNGTSVGRVCRLNSDGSLDTGFNSGGAGANNTPYSIVVQTDGKILIGGTFTTYNGTSVGRVCRLNSDGSLDTGFNSGGAGANNNVYSMAVQGDGKILIGGTFTTYNGTTVGRFCRLNSDGSLDTGFNSGGAGANSGVINSIAIQPDGKILIGGSSYSSRFKFTAYNGTTVGYFCRVNSDGSLDTGFNSGGAEADNSVYSVALQTDGKILIGGTFTTYNNVTTRSFAKLNSDGTLYSGGSSDTNYIPNGFYAGDPGTTLITVYQILLA